MSPTCYPEAHRKEWDFWAVINVGTATSWQKAGHLEGATEWSLDPFMGSMSGQVGDLSPSQEKSLAQVSEGRDSYTSRSFSFCHGEGQDSRSLRFF